jgi:hypothetical protein
MFTKHNIVRLLIFGLASSFIVGCASSTTLTEVISVPNEKWRITSVSVTETTNGLRVSGRLNSPNIFVLPDGYILVSTRSEDGAILAQKKASYRRITGNAWRHRRHQYGVAFFSVYFESISEVAKVVTEHRKLKQENIPISQ